MTRGVKPSFVTQPATHSTPKSAWKVLSCHGGYALTWRFRKCWDLSQWNSWLSKSVCLLLNGIPEHAAACRSLLSMPYFQNRFWFIEFSICYALMSACSSGGYHSVIDIRLLSQPVHHLKKSSMWISSQVSFEHLLCRSCTICNFRLCFNGVVASGSAIVQQSLNPKIKAVFGLRALIYVRISVWCKAQVKGSCLNCVWVSSKSRAVTVRLTIAPDFCKVAGRLSFLMMETGYASVAWRFSREKYEMELHHGLWFFFAIYPFACRANCSILVIIPAGWDQMATKDSAKICWYHQSSKSRYHYSWKMACIAQHSNLFFNKLHVADLTGWKWILCWSGADKRLRDIWQIRQSQFKGSQ